MYPKLFAVMIGAAAMAAAPAMGQRSAAEIVLTSSQTQAGYSVLGEVRAEVHQKSLFPKTPSRDLADQELRAKAAKLGADAVIDVKYENNSPMTSKKGFIAVGKAVKFQTVTAAPAVAQAVPVAAPPVVAAPSVVATPTAVASSATAPVVAAPPVAAPVVTAAAIPPPPESAPKPPVPGPRPPTAQALIVLSEDNLASRAVAVLGVVSAEAHQTSLFPKKSARDMLEDDLRAKAFALGADAVVSIKYESSSPMTSKKGSRATGVAVKF